MAEAKDEAAPTQNRYEYDIVVTVRKLSVFVSMRKVAITLPPIYSERIRHKIQGE
jgi:hypothetical protein